VATPGRSLVLLSPKSVRAERRFRELIEAAPEAIIELDRKGRIVLLNGMTEKLFGYRREELLGQPVEALNLCATHPHNWRACRTVAVEARRKDGSCFPVEISLSPVKSRDGFSVIAIIRDVGGRQKAEDQQRAIQERFIRELQSRHREMERTDRLKGEFLISMSHELRTPLDTVIGFSELLAEEMKGPLNEDQKRFVQYIHRDALHLLELINEILDLSKIEAGRLELRTTTFDMSAAIEETLSSIRLRSEAKSIRIETQIATRFTLHADRLRFKQILFNLLSNAVKFTPERGEIRIEAARGDGLVEIAVSDNGIGIAEDEHQSIFDKFHQVIKMTKGEGTGLGLAITKALVEQHGGHIWLESEPGEGSRFTFTIPAETTAAQVTVR
jgi:PAS domain S-box-containing protein